MAGNLQPLDEKFAIVDQFGKPTLYFIKWAQQRQIDITEGITLQDLIDYLTAHQLQEGSGIQITPSGNLSDSPTIAADVQEILDQITSTRGSILYRGLLGWSALAPGAAGQFLKTNGAGADPAWAAPGASALTLISEVVTAGSATNVQFAAIANTYRDLEVRIRGRGTKAAVANVDVRMRFNGDTGANYDNESTQGSGATTTSFGSLAQTSAYIGNLPAATAPANAANSIIVQVPNYKGTTFQKDALYRAGLKAGTAVVANLFTEMGSNYWRSTVAITQIDVFPGANAFVDGTVISLYGSL